MPTSKRDLIKRKHTAIQKALVRSQGWLQELSVMFEEHHPEYSTGYMNIWVILDQAHDFVTKMKGFI